MSRLDALEEILNRIEQKQHTDEDIQSLRQFLSASDREVAERFAKYNVNIGEGNNIEIGDRTYVEWNQEAVRELIEQIQKQSYAIPLLPKELPQKDYLRLKHLLASGRWREANEQTRVILLRAVNTEENYLNDEQIQNFPCQVLKIIDRLWLKYSNGRFGFSIQKQIFDECKKISQHSAITCSGVFKKIGYLAIELFILPTRHQKVIYPGDSYKSERWITFFWKPLWKVLK